MLLVGVTGGIGSGKSTFAALLAERGAHVIDADQIGREALLPGKPAWHSVVDQFGDEILAASSMDVDRAALARIVFADPKKLAALNAIVHPVIVGEIADRLERFRAAEDIVVLDAALILELGLAAELDVLVGLIAERPTREQRLVRRGLSLTDARARMGAQTDPRELIAKADIVVTNDGSLDDLAAKADEVWRDLLARTSR
ncbi:MAG TPA: dephospho-CoA kinase [Actinomycetota bacterium]|nr:dephospho-CoA kinase [Actinomycetota bacterium]